MITGSALIPPESIVKNHNSNVGDASMKTWPYAKHTTPPASGNTAQINTNFLNLGRRPQVRYQFLRRY